MLAPVLKFLTVIRRFVTQKIHLKQLNVKVTHLRSSLVVRQCNGNVSLFPFLNFYHRTLRQPQRGTFLGRLDKIFRPHVLDPSKLPIGQLDQLSFLER